MTKKTYGVEKYLILKFSQKKILEKCSKDIDSILLAIPSLKKPQKKEVINSIQKYNVPILEVPSIEEIASGDSKS